MTSEPPPLPPREPRPLVVHFLVDGAVCFLAVIMLAIIWEVSWGVVLAASVVVGAIAAPLTRRAEERQLAQRAAAPDVDPSA